MPQVNDLAKDQTRQRHTETINVSEFIRFAVKKMQEDHWSPDAICAYVKAHRQFDNAMVCTKTLYRYIDLGLLPVKNIDLPLKVSRKTKSKRIRQHKKVLGATLNNGRLISMIVRNSSIGKSIPY